MSYSFNNPCWNCKKREELNCKDAEKIQTAVNHIHLDNDGTHQGAGQIVLMCCRHQEK